MSTSGIPTRTGGLTHPRPQLEAMEFPAHPGLTLPACPAPAGSPTAGGLKMLASWAATAEQAGKLPGYA